MLDDSRIDRTPTPSRLLSWLFRPRDAEPLPDPEPTPIVVRPRRPAARVAPCVPRASVSAAASPGDDRRAPRAPLHVAGGLTRAGSPAILPARTLDVSRSGALVFTLADVLPREPIHHLLRFRGDDQSTPIAGRVVWRRARARGFEVGVAYDVLHHDTAARLATWVDHRFADVRQLQFLLALGRRSPQQERQLDQIARRLGAPAGAEERRGWLAHTAAAFRHAP